LANVICQIPLKKFPSKSGGVSKRFPIKINQNKKFLDRYKRLPLTDQKRSRTITNCHMDLPLEDFPGSHPGSPLTECEIFRISYFTAKQFSCQDIASMLNRHLRTISRTIQKFQPYSSKPLVRVQSKSTAKHSIIPSLPLVGQNQVPN
jgi:hypothetical protein